MAAGERVDQAKADELVSQLAGLQMVRPLGKQGKAEYGLETPRATATLTLSGTQDITQTITVDVGALDEAAGDVHGQVVGVGVLCQRGQVCGAGPGGPDPGGAAGGEDARGEDARGDAAEQPGPTPGGTP